MTHITSTATTLTVVTHAITPSARCPRCAQPSTRVHSRYTRAPRDLPVSDRAVSLVLCVRRFFCRNLDCPQRTFAERFPTVVPVRAQRTLRLTRTLQVLGFALGGEAGARVGAHLHLQASPDTLLRIVRHTPSIPQPTPRVLGVDDFAVQKGRVYGTLLVDLEQRRPIDVLPDRTAETLAAWLRRHPGVEVIARDRSPEYVRGITAGAPGALQVADRWHLLLNLREALERLLNRLHTRLRARLETAPVPATTAAAGTLSLMRQPRRPSARERAAQQARRARRSALYQQVRTLHTQGVKKLQIAKRLGISRRTVRTFADAEAYPERAPRHPTPGILAPYEPYLQVRWEAGCQNSLQLWHELQAQGFPGSRKPVARWVQQRRVSPAPTTPRKYLHQRQTAPTRASATANLALTRPAAPAPRQLVWLLLREYTRLNAEERAILARMRQDREVETAYALAQRFRTLVHDRVPAALAPWLSAAAASRIPDLQTFAAGLQRDYPAVEAALRETWSTGQLEGQVNRLKLIKRQMYGRANFDLLRQRVLHAA